jgi:hypothetical protein
MGFSFVRLYVLRGSFFSKLNHEPIGAILKIFLLEVMDQTTAAKTSK